MQCLLMAYETIFFGALAALFILVFEGFRMIDLARDKGRKLMREINAYEEKITAENIKEWFERLTTFRQPRVALNYAVGISVIVLILTAIGSWLPGSTEYVVVVSESGGVMPLLNVLLIFSMMAWLIVLAGILWTYYVWVYRERHT